MFSGYDGLALFRIFAFAGRYADALMARSEAMAILANDRSRILPRDHSRVCGICRDWLNLSTGARSSCRGPQDGKLNNENKPWVIIGPKCAEEDILSLQLSTYTAVSLNKPLPSWLDTYLTIETDEIVFLNGENGKRLSDRRILAPFSGVCEKKRTIYFKYPKHAQIVADQFSQSGSSIQVGCAENIESLYVNGSPNMLPTALASAEKIGVSDVYILGFDLYSSADLQSKTRCSDHCFDSAHGALLHDPLEQRLVLQSIFARTGYHSDSLLQSALNFSDLELLERVGGELTH